MYIRKIKISNIRGINGELDLDFIPTQDRTYQSNIEDFGLEKNKTEFNALKQIALLGKNASGKSSVLEGIVIAFGLGVDSFNYVRFLPVAKNLASDGPFNFSFEIVGKPKHSKNLVEKYVYSYTFDKGIFIKEKLERQTATKTSRKELEEVFRVENNELFLNNKKTNIRHNGIASIMTLLRNGGINPDIIKAFKGSSFYNQIFIFFESMLKATFPLMGTVSALAPPETKGQKELYMKFLKMFDKNIVDVRKDSMGKYNVYCKTKNSEFSYPLNRAESFMSAGTITGLLALRTLINGMITKNIIVYDELGKSIHEGLFVALFEIFKISLKSQFIFSTHQSQIFKQSIRMDQIFNVSSNDGKINVKRISDIDDKLDKRYINVAKVNKILNNTPTFEEFNEVIGLVEDYKDV